MPPPKSMNFITVKSRCKNYTIRDLFLKIKMKLNMSAMEFIHYKYNKFFYFIFILAGHDRIAQLSFLILMFFASFFICTKFLRYLNNFKKLKQTATNSLRFSCFPWCFYLNVFKI